MANMFEIEIKAEENQGERIKRWVVYNRIIFWFQDLIEGICRSKAEQPVRQFIIVPKDAAVKYH